MKSTIFINILVTSYISSSHKDPSTKYCLQTYEFKISESAAPGTKIGQVVIYDGDGIDQLELSIREQQARKNFRIESSGELYTNRKLDFEAVQRLVLEHCLCVSLAILFATWG